MFSAVFSRHSFSRLENGSASPPKLSTAGPNHARHVGSRFTALLSQITNVIAAHRASPCSRTHTPPWFLVRLCAPSNPKNFILARKGTRSGCMGSHLLLHGLNLLGEHELDVAGRGHVGCKTQRQEKSHRQHLFLLEKPSNCPNTGPSRNVHLANTFGYWAGTVRGMGGPGHVRLMRPCAR